MKQDFLFVRALENKLDGDVPLGVKLLKCERHPGGFWTRAEVVAKK
jgi:hypothetical protein